MTPEEPAEHAGASLGRLHQRGGGLGVVAVWGSTGPSSTRPRRAMSSWFFRRPSRSCSIAPLRTRCWSVSVSSDSTRSTSSTMSTRRSPPASASMASRARLNSVGASEVSVQARRFEDVVREQMGVSCQRHACCVRVAVDSSDRFVAVLNRLEDSAGETGSTRAGAPGERKSVARVGADSGEDTREFGVAGDERPAVVETACRGRRLSRV